MKTYLLP